MAISHAARLRAADVIEAVARAEERVGLATAKVLGEPDIFRQLAMSHLLHLLMPDGAHHHGGAAKVLDLGQELLAVTHAAHALAPVDQERTLGRPQNEQRTSAR